MSRKPTAISLGDKRSENPNTPAEKARKKAKASARKPQATKAPAPAEAEEVFESDIQHRDTPSSVRPLVRRSRWTVVFLACFIGLVSLGIGLWFTQVVEGLFARSDWLGWLASTLLAVAVLSLIVLLSREIFALWRLRKLDRLRGDVTRVLEGAGQTKDRLLDRLVGLYENRPEMEWHISRLASHSDEIMDARDRMLLAERYLMKPLDNEAQQIITTAAKRISVVTAVNPAASLDVLFTGYQVLRMLRQLTALYGGRPGGIGTLKLAGMVGSHLAVTGGLALSDALLQQFIGKGLAGRLSAKLGEGTVNGILTARIGIAAMDLCRPMPFCELPRPGLKDFAATIAGSISGNRGQASESP